MNDEQADLRVMYQLYSSQIEFSKNQQWRVAYYGILVFAGILGIYELIDRRPGFNLDIHAVWWVKIALRYLIILVTFLGTLLLTINEMAIIKGRKKFRLICGRLSPVFRELVRYPRRYTSFTYDVIFFFPLVSALGVGCFLVTFYIYVNIGVAMLLTIPAVVLGFLLGMLLSWWQKRQEQAAGEMHRHASFGDVLRRMRCLVRWVYTGERPSDSYSCLHKLLRCICSGRGSGGDRDGA